MGVTLKLFEPASIGVLTLKNRIVMPAMATLFGERGGRTSSGLVAYYARRARGGAGLVIVENTAVHPQGVNYPGTLEIHGEEFEEGLVGLASAIKAGGAAAAIQLFHPGRQVHPKYAGNYPVAPSPIPCPVMGGNPKELEPEEIRDLVRRFAQGAARAKKAGFDAVEIHGAHGYLVGQFLSPASNRREDRYGGDTERRARFAVEIVETIRGEVGDTFPVIFRISADEKVDGGLTLDETRSLLPHLERAGVSAFHVSAGCYASMEWVVQPYLQSRGCLAPLAARVRAATGLPLVTVGRINDPAVAESILAGGAADLVAMGRALIADPDLPAKAREGRLGEIRPCIACNVCIEAVGVRRTRCAVNPGMGKESDPGPAAGRVQKVLVVGGGPAGMEAALRARALGHRVKLAEAAGALGGQLTLAGVPDSKAEIRRLLDHLRLTVEKSGVEVELGRPVDCEAVERERPDRVILATGAVPRDAGVSAGKGAPRLLRAADVLREARPLTGEVAVVGGGLVGLDTAEFLASHGARVTVLEMERQAGQRLEWNVRKMKLSALGGKGVRVLTRAKMVRVEQGSLIYAGPDGAEHSVPADAVVVAMGSTPHNPLEAELRDKGFAVTCIGDCSEARSLAEAFSEGYEAAFGLGAA
jgi:2,4-dienoyl-CoA reductase-like NADH-dependent reductase (Old Yellow Enzyme family)/thioredoxin reductase